MNFDGTTSHGPCIRTVRGARQQDDGRHAGHDVPRRRGTLTIPTALRFCYPAFTSGTVFVSSMHASRNADAEAVQTEYENAGSNPNEMDMEAAKANKSKALASANQRG